MKPEHHKSLKILVFSKSVEYRHESVPEALDMMKELAIQNSWIKNNNRRFRKLRLK